MKFRTLITSALVAATVIAPAVGIAQTKLKWAHVYETSEPYHRIGMGGAEIKEAHQRQVRHPGVPGLLAWARKPTSIRA